MFNAHINNVIVKVNTKYHKDFGNMIARANMNPTSEVNPADFVNITGEVISVPKRISSRADYKGFSVDDIYPGDTAIFRYDVVYDLIKQDADKDPIYRNEIWWKGETYFAADIQKIFGVIRAGEIIMVNGYVMVEDMSAPHAIIMPQAQKHIQQAAYARLTQVGRPLEGQKPISAQTGDIVYYDPFKLQNYEIGGKKFGILSQRMVLGRKVASYADFHLVK